MYSTRQLITEFTQHQSSKVVLLVISCSNSVTTGKAITITITTQWDDMVEIIFRMIFNDN